jgi:hypothetical protein
MGFSTTFQRNPLVRVFRPPPFTDKAETAVEGGSVGFPGGFDRRAIDTMPLSNALAG